MDNYYVKWANIMACILLAGCQIPAARIATGVGAMPVYDAPPRSNYDVPPQTIYAINSNRYFTLENYSRCGGSQVYYNDTSNHIKTLLKFAISGFPGRFHIDGNSNVLVFPDSLPEGSGLCGSDRGCFLAVYYSLDGGRTFDWFHPWELSGDRKKSYEKAQSLTVTLQDKQLYVADKDSAYVFTLEKGIKGAGNTSMVVRRMFPMSAHPPARTTSPATTAFIPKRSRNRLCISGRLFVKREERRAMEILAIRGQGSC